LGYGLLEGVISFPNKDDLVLRAPLINIEIEIIKDASGEIVIKKNNNDVIANELLELYVDEQLEKSTRLASEIEKDLFLANGYFAHIANVIPNVEIDNDYSLITNLSKENLLKQSPYLKIKKSFFIISFNPTGGKMLKDYDAIIEQNYQFPTYDTIFHQNLDHLIFDADQIYQINSPLNLIQKLAIVNSMNKNILIYGPPGTGKSEVVANAIANALINNKNIVAISEKKAALDVLDQRLLALNTLSMSAFDEKNSDVFYKRIINMNHLIVSVNDLELQINNQSYQTLIQYQKL
jgi:hypothetical protein